MGPLAPQLTQSLAGEARGKCSFGWDGFQSSAAGFFVQLCSLKLEGCEAQLPVQLLSNKLPTLTGETLNSNCGRELKPILVPCM